MAIAGGAPRLVQARSRLWYYSRDWVELYLWLAQTLEIVAITLLDNAIAKIGKVPKAR